MSTSIDQKAYLQKYLSGPSGEKKKKKKKVVKGKGFKIIDDDLDLTKLRPLDGDEVDFLGEGEDAPQIAGIIDERPEEVKKLEQFKTSSKWRVINQDDGFTSKLQIEEVKKDVKEVQKENELIFGKMYSDSEDDKKADSDASPPRKQSNANKGVSSKKKPQNNSDSDFSPPRKSRRESPPKTKEKNYDSDPSPPRRHDKEFHKKTKDRIRKPSRWGDEKDSNKRGSMSPKAKKSPRKTRQSDSDASPPRRQKSSPDRRKKNDDFEELTKRRNKNDSDASPPRKSRKEIKRRKSTDSDPSPPRKRSDNQNKYGSRNDKSSNRYGESSQRQRGKSPDSDLSPPRKRPSPKRPRKQSPDKHSKRKQDSDSDLSPPRRGRESRREESSRSDQRTKPTSDSPPPSNKKMATRTLEGKMAGLQNATQLRDENEAFRRREEEAFSRMSDQVSGRNAQAVSRKAKRETSEERNKLKEKQERQKELDEKYKKWSKGLKQIQEQETRVQDFLHEASKPLARHKDDRDLEHSLKNIERDGDPMLQYIRERKRERGELGPERPTYKGSFPPNRFNIRPGHRWDGVDRSNGYENKYFTEKSKRKALEDEAYKWSTEDL